MSAVAAASGAVASVGTASAADVWTPPLLNTNACPGPYDVPPVAYKLPVKVATAVQCEMLCKANATCPTWAWSPNTHSCYYRLDGVWKPGSPSSGYESGCIMSGPRAVFGCGLDPKTAACPTYLAPPPRQTPAAPAAASTASAGAAVAGAADVHTTSGAYRMLGVNFDFWPPSHPAWGTCGVLSSKLSDARLRATVQGLRGALLRIGGSPADFTLYDVFPGACSAANLAKEAKPKSGYFCRK